MLVAKSECPTPFQGSWTLGYHFLYFQNHGVQGALKTTVSLLMFSFQLWGQWLFLFVLNQRPGLHLVETVDICT